MADDVRHLEAIKSATRRQGSIGATARAVFWSFFGVRKGKDHARDIEQLNPVHVVVMGVIGAAIFIAVLITIVTLVVPG